MGAAKVVAVGRGTKTLDKLVHINPQRIISVALHGDASEYGKQIQQAAGEVDMVLNVLGGVKNPDLTIACINALRPHGTAVFMGGVQSDIPLPYAQIMLKEITIQGTFMFPQQGPYELIRMVAAGTRAFIRNSNSSF
ncbi:MAG: zinc-binding dehydrogenase [Calothrix sp. FI2-JRJ7]|jgi:alcohol dehydrogenase|nr:zinc-binding dehydrogenase [Calothrix sp. FI2-JRJ7]